MLHLIAWMVIVLKTIELVCMPALFGEKKTHDTWDYTTWFGAFLGGCLVIPMALSVLGYI